MSEPAISRGVERTMRPHFVALISCAALFGQSTTPATTASTFHVSGMMTQCGKAFPKLWVTFEQGPKDPANDVLSAKPSEHIWLRDSSFPDGLKAYSATMAWAVEYIQKRLKSNLIRSAKCMGQFGAGKVTEDGGFKVFRVVREGNKWTISVNRFNKQDADAFRARADKGDINVDKEYYGNPAATLVIKGTYWTLSLPTQPEVISGTLKGE
jgi:hypothetical protein